MSGTPPRALFDRYCVTCHNQRAKIPAARPLALDTADLATVASDPDLWENVVRKLRAGTMPPAGAARPPGDEADAAATWLERELDRSADARPDPGHVPAFRRLTRTEYRHAVRDLLALDDLPKELDIELLLPADNTVGFDTIADALFVTPTLLEGYLTAARKLAAIAVGDASMPLIVDTYRTALEQPQDEQFADLPVGTRGGMRIRRWFPLTGEYRLRVELAGPLRERHELEVAVDGERVQLVPVGGPAGQPRASASGGEGDGLEITVPVQAGQRTVGVSFVKRTSAYAETLTVPFRRGRGLDPAVSAVTISGPFGTRSAGDTSSRRRVLRCGATASASSRSAGATSASSRTVGSADCARQIVRLLAKRAFRRAATIEDVHTLMPFFEAGRRGGTFDAGIQRVIERVLVSPEFLFRVEGGSKRRDGAAAAPVSDVELASRLSFFLWSSIPDDELLDVAIEGRLRAPGVFEAQVRRMLADRRSDALVTNFAAQWLYLWDLPARRPNDRLFPDFDDGLRQAMVRETELFLGSVLRENRSVVDLVSSRDTFLNERLARHYGIPGIYGSDFRRITLPDGSVRGGLLGQGSILTLTSYATRTSPVVRGKWILENILGSPPPPPPPNVPALKTDDNPKQTRSMRERMTQHRANPVCASCHARMDPLGFALENFDAIGRWRAQGDGGTAIDASGTLPDGTAFKDPLSLRAALVQRPERFVTTFTEKLLNYAIGRNLIAADSAAVRAIVREAFRDGYRFEKLVLGIVASRPFQLRRSES
ncbi:MAG: DUF1592 domain-containing protein [Acidimicrobiia bacterium]|nr:DUF1592 domain-containing protein [Acidimicrobiia bacterium]